MIERFRCPECGSEYYLPTGCSCCGGDAHCGPYYCPECKALLEGQKRVYISGFYDEE